MITGTAPLPQSPISATTGGCGKPIWGRLRKAYLEQYRHRLYTALVASEKLYPHLAETDRAARDMLDYLMPRLAREAGATETLKAADPMKWVGLMNNCKARAEEIIRHELIYV